MPHDQRPQLAEHIELRVEVVLEQTLVRAASGAPGLLVHRPVVVNRLRVHVVHGTDEELEREARQGLLDEGSGDDGADPFGLEADEDFDLRGVFRAQAGGFLEVGGFVGDEFGEGVAGFDLGG